MNQDPYYSHAGIEIYQGDAFEVLKAMPDESVQTCVTSPPYWRQRDYGVEGQLGLEGTPAEYLWELGRVFSQVRRVLKADGTLWLNMGDGYVTRPNGPQAGKTSQLKHSRQHVVFRAAHAQRSCRLPPGLKHKDMIGMPWRLAFALQEAGWYLRSDVIWHKPTAMPESVKDRPTKAHEYLFLLSKNGQYHYDQDAIKVKTTGNAHSRGRGDNPKANIPTGWQTGDGAHDSLKGRHPRPKQNPSWSKAVTETVEYRNMRTVWTVQSKPFREAHFATFPPKLIEPCIKACARPGDVVLDPFTGAGTTAVVARDLGCLFKGAELNPEYIDLAAKRLSQGVLPLGDPDGEEQDKLD